MSRLQYNKVGWSQITETVHKIQRYRKLWF